MDNLNMNLVRLIADDPMRFNDVLGASIRRAIEMNDEKESDMFRVCDCCGKIMQEGFCLGGGEEYFCSESCLSCTYNNEDIKQLGIGDGDSDSYWTEWR